MSKAFDKVSHRPRIHKLIQAGFGGNLLNWFCSYLSSQHQRVTVLSSSSRVLMFTDDTKIFRDKDFEGCLSSTGRPWEAWSQSSGLLFNEAKCKAQHITRKTKPTLSSYELNNTALELYAAEKDLAIWINKVLTWYKQVNEESSQANKLLGYLKRNTRFILRTKVRRKLYLALVRPHLGYANQIWAPQSIELIVKLERIQRRATKFFLKTDSFF